MKYIKLFEDFRGWYKDSKWSGYKSIDKNKLGQNFWKWFGNSLVKDDNGDPVIMYHGSNHLHNIKEFKSPRGYYFFTTSKMEAARYITASHNSQPDWDEVDKNIGAFFIKAEKLFDPSDMSEDERKSIYNLFEKKGSIIIEDLRYETDIVSDAEMEGSEEDDFSLCVFILEKMADNFYLLEHDIVQEWIRSNGYDSFSTIESGDGFNIAVYSPNQIKSVNAVNFSNTGNVYESVKESYIGNCVEVGDGISPINNIFSDATEMAYYVDEYDSDGNLENATYISREEFLKKVNVSNSMLNGQVQFIYIPKLNLYCIYNMDLDIHYFFYSDINESVNESYNKYYFLRWTSSPEDDIKRNFSGHMQTWVGTKKEAEEYRSKEEKSGRYFNHPIKQDPVTGDWNYDPEWGISGYYFNDKKSFNEAMEKIKDISWFHKDSNNQDLGIFCAKEMGSEEGYDGEELFRDISFIKYIDEDTKFEDIGLEI